MPNHTESTPEQSENQIRLEDGKIFEARQQRSLRAPGESTFPSIVGIYHWLEKNNLVEQLAGDAQSPLDFIQKLKNIRNQPRPDSLYFDYQGFTIWIDLLEHPDEIKNDVGTISIQIANKFKRYAYSPSAPDFKDETQANKARAILEQILGST